MKLKQLLFICLTLFVWASSCTKETKDNDNKPIVTDDDNGGGGCDTSFIPGFAEKVFPILQTNCLGCHSASGPSGGVNLSTYQSAKNNASKLIPAVTHPSGLPTNKKMPPGGKLPECDIITIERWSNSGFPE